MMGFTHFADHAWSGTVRVHHQRPLARDTFLLRLECAEVARQITPGQFVMLRLSESSDPLLGRPLALYDVVRDDQGHAWGIDVVYLVVGKMTRRLASVPAGQELSLWGPLGNGFPASAVEHLVMVAGGIGQTPFLALAQEYLGQRRFGDPPRLGARAGRVTFCYGARSREYLAGVEDFSRLGVEVRISTDDGSAGRAGRVTEVLAEVLASTSPAGTQVVCCGPEPMMKAVAQQCARAGVACQVSLETPMACGLGICFSCVARVRDAHGTWDYRRTCVEGPVFDAALVEF